MKLLRILINLCLETARRLLSLYGDKQCEKTDCKKCKYLSQYGWCALGQIEYSLIPMYFDPDGTINDDVFSEEQIVEL